jgi:hypothetical protein
MKEKGRTIHRDVRDVLDLFVHIHYHLPHSVVAYASLGVQLEAVDDVQDDLCSWSRLRLRGRVGFEGWIRLVIDDGRRRARGRRARGWIIWRAG